MPDISQMQTFLLISELGSLSAAARKLNISAAAVSKQLTKLEQELSVQLLIRTTRHIELTEIGASYCEQCRRILEEVDAATALISNVKEFPHGNLKVVAARHFGISYIVPHVKDFLLKYPDIELDLELAERIPNLNIEPIDVIIGMSVPATEDVVQKQIATTSYSLCASPEYLRQFGTPKTPKDLKKHRYITHSMRQRKDEIIFHKNEKVTVHPYLHVNDTRAMLQLALEGLGLVHLHHYVVERYIKEGKLHEVLPSLKKTKIPLFVAYPQRRHISAKTRCFIDFFVQKI